MTKLQQAKADKLIVLVRYLLKQDAKVNGVFCKKGTIILRVRNHEGREYLTILRRNKQHACNCAHKPSEKCPECYHILVGKRIENARAEAVKALHRDIHTFLANERKAQSTPNYGAGVQAIERRLSRAGLMR